MNIGFTRCCALSVLSVVLCHSAVFGEAVASDVWTKAMERLQLFEPHQNQVATLLFDASTDIRKVQELLGPQYITTTQIYDKRRRTTAESASHDMPI